MYTVSAVKLTEDKVFIAYINRTSSNATSFNVYGIVCTINDTEIIAHSDKQISDNINLKLLSLITLTENKVFIAYAYSSNQRLRGIVCRINEAEIIEGMNTILNSNAFSGASISAVKLTENKVLIAHSVNKSGNGDYGFLYSMICTIDDTEITVESDIQLTNTYYTAYTVSAVALTENKVFVAYVSRTSTNASSDYNLRSMICTINNTEIIVDNDIELVNSIHTAGYTINAIILSDSQVFITYSYDFTITTTTVNHHLYGMLCRINNSEITVEENVLLSQNDSTASLGEVISTTLINNKIFVSYSKGKYISSGTQHNYSTYALITNYVFEAMLQKVKNKYQKIEGIAKTSGSDGQLVKAVVPIFEEEES